MPRACTVCTHPARGEIDKALLSGASFRNVAERFSRSTTALYRHKTEHLPEAIKRAAEAQRTETDLDVMTELKRLFVWMNKLGDACDRWLSDPDAPDRYDLGPRASEVMVHYEDMVYDDQGEAHVTRRKAPLSELLDMARERTPERAYTLIEVKHADPRKLIVATAARLHGQIELLAKLIGRLDERPLNIILAPEWIALRTAMIEALADHPEAQLAVAQRLLALEAGPS